MPYKNLGQKNRLKGDEMKTEEGALTFPFSGPRGAQFILETTDTPADTQFSGSERGVHRWKPLQAEGCGVT